jgi:hypothetical protein
MKNINFITMKKSLYILSIFILFSCGKKNSPPPINGDTTKIAVQDSPKKQIDTLDPEYIAVDLVMQLPEIIELGNTIEKESKGTHHLSAMITETPGENEKGYYVVKISEDTEDRLVGIHLFYVYVPSYEIMYYDPVKDKEVSLEVWRKGLKAK